MLEQVPCLLLAESSDQRATRSSKKCSSSTSRVHALLPRRAYKNMYRAIFDFLETNNIVFNASISTTEFSSSVNSTKIDLFMAQFNSTDAWSTTKNIVITVHEYNRELTRLLFSKNINQIRSIDLFQKFPPSISVVDQENARLIAGCLAHGIEINYRHHSGRTALHFAVEEGNLALVKSFLKYGYIVTAADCENRSPLHIAAQKGDFKVVKALVDHGADVNSITISDESECTSSTPLLLATASGSCEVVKLLLDKGADFNYVDHTVCQGTSLIGPHHDATPLHLAANTGHVQVVNLLVQYGAKLEVKMQCDLLKCSSPLVFAAEKGHFKVVQLLLERGADVHGVHHVDSAVGMTALHLAASKGHLKVAQNLLNLGASVYSRANYGLTPLHVAATEENINVVKLFLEAGADINAVFSLDNVERSIFHIIFDTENKKLLDLLLSRRSDLSDDLVLRAFYYSVCRLSKFCAENHGCLSPPSITLDNDSLRNVDETELLMGAIHKSQPEIIEQLLLKGVSLNCQYQLCIPQPFKTTPLHYAVMLGKEPIVKLLLSHGADVNALDEKNNSPMDYAVSYQRTDIVKLLIKNKANIHGAQMMMSALASSDHCQELIEVLLQNGADPDTVLKSVSITLYAVTLGNLELVKLLLRFGGSIHTQFACENPTDGPASCLHVAAVHKQFEIFQFLLDCSFHDIESINRILLYVVNVASLQHYASALGRSIVKMMSAGVPISGKRLKDLFGETNEAFHSGCKAEISMLKNEKFEGTDVNLYDVLMNDVERIVGYARNKSIVEYFKSGDYKNKFPIYASIIEWQFEKGCDRRDLLAYGIRVFSSLFKQFVTLPDELKEKIVGLLENRELRTLHCL